MASQQATVADRGGSRGQSLQRELSVTDIPSTASEMIKRLMHARPEALSAGGRIRGITPAALAALLVQARKLDRAA